MSTFKVNYAGLRKPQKKVESPTNQPNSSTTTSNQPTARTNLQITPPGSNASSATKLGQAGVLSMYQDNFQSDNLDYIQNLLKSKASNNPSKGGQGGGAKKKGHLRTRSTLAGSAQIQPQVDSPEINSVGLSETPLSKNSKIDQLPYMKPDYDDGYATINQDKEQLHESTELQNGIEDDDEAPDTARNITNTPTRHEGKLFDRYFKDDGGIGRRSMSLDDPRIDKKIFPKTTTNNRNTHRNPAEADYYSMEKSLEGSLQQDSTKHSNVSHKNEFLHSLNNFLSYFQKSENMSYRNMKAGQYFRSNIGKSHRSVQKELDVSHQELRNLKSQNQELKHRVNELMSGNKYLTKELKHSNAREEENQQIFHKMQTEITRLKQKNRHYKTQCIQLQEAFKRERMESESNLLALKQVLAKSINVALEHKNPPYLSGSKDKNLQSQYLAAGDKKEKTSKSNLKDKRRTNGTLEGYESLYEMPSQYTRSKDLLETPKRDISGLQQYPYVTVSSEEGGEGFSNLETSSVMGYGLSYEDEGSKYQHEYQEELMKDQQIQFLQEKLAELMNSEEVSFSGQNSYMKSNSKTNRSKQGYKKNPSNLATPSYYVSRDRQGSMSKLSNLSVKYDTRDQRSIAVRDDYEESPSVNNGTERSFSMHNSD